MRPQVKLAHGNHKIGKDTLIVNMGSATDCPSRKLGYCQLENPSACYALKAERMYPNVLPSRREQSGIWGMLTAQEVATDILTRVCSSYYKHPITFLRYSEAGDFLEQADVDKMSEIADALKDAGIRVYGYTARWDLDYSQVSTNMVVIGSGFMVHNEFRAVPHSTGEHPVCPGNCRTCRLCKESRGIVIEAVYH